MAEMSEKKQEAIESLPNELIPVFDELVSDYKHSASARHGSPFVSFIVLADLIRSGWRPSADPLKVE